MTPTRRKALAIAVATILVSVALIAAGWVITNNKVNANQHEQNHKFCAFLRKIDYPRPSTGAADKFTTALREYEKEIDCND
jgi:hypothetical protein